MMLALNITKPAMMRTVVGIETTPSRSKKKMDNEFMSTTRLKPVINIARKIKLKKIFSNNSCELLVIVLNRLYFVSARNSASG